MTKIHAWFSAERALRHGSSIYRKPSGATVNVTRVNSDNQITGFYRHTEKYVGEVIPAEDGGCVQLNTRAASIPG